LPAEVVADLLRGHGVADEAMLRRLARLSGGSLGTALELADPALWGFREALVGGLTAAPIDTVRLAEQWMKFVEGGGKEPAVKRGRASAVLRLLVDLVDDALAVRSGGVPRRTGEEDRPAVQTLARREPEVLLA